MKNMTLCVLALFWASASQAQDIPSLQDFFQKVRQSEAPATIAAKSSPAPKAAASFGSAQALRLVQRWPRKEFTFDLKDGDVVVARIEGASDGYELRDASGALLAATHETRFKKGRTIRVVDGEGAAIGTIVMGDRPWAGRKSFEVQDPSGKLLGRTGTVDYLQHPFQLDDASGARAALFEEQPHLLSRWTMRFDPASSIDRRLIVLILPYNEAADQ